MKRSLFLPAEIESDDPYARISGRRQTLVRVNGGQILQVDRPWEEVLAYVEAKFCGRDSEA